MFMYTVSQLLIYSTLMQCVKHFHFVSCLVEAALPGGQGAGFVMIAWPLE